MPFLTQADTLILTGNTMEILPEKANFSITQTCFKEPALNSDVNNCATLGRITILAFTFLILSVK